jgi:hypothetical protein
MNVIEESLQKLNAMVLDGRAMEAFEKFYHPDVVMQENEQVPTVGKDANRKREMEFFSKVQEFRGAQVKGLAVGDNYSTVVWHYDYTHADWGVRNYTQVSVQHWHEGKIIREQFFYGS